MIRSTIFSVLVALVLTACAGLGADPATTERTPPPADSLHVLYQAAIEDAEQARPSDIYRGLTPVIPHNASLVWRDVPGESAVLVATWTDDSFPDGASADSIRTDGDTWVTVAPELANFCQDLDKQGDALDVRLAQLLGLPPDVQYDRVVEIWVHPEDLFRPCPDPEISDSQCELSLPQPTNLVQVDESHTEWMEANAAGSYTTDGYPWTRLGYTYDWGNPDHNIGLSEFVIQPGSAVAIHEISPTNAYCQ